MPEPRADRIDVNARLKKMTGGRVANDMGTDPLSLVATASRYATSQCSVRRACECRSGSKAPPAVQEQVRLRRALTGEVPEML